MMLTTRNKTDNKPTYQHIHLVGHSAGAKLIDQASNDITVDRNRKSIHLTFLDAYAPIGSEDYGASLSGYLEHYAEQYLDTGGPTETDTVLPYARNFDITSWKPVSESNPNEKEGFYQIVTGHQWPRYWYEKSVTTPEYKFGYHLSLEGGTAPDPLQQFMSKWPLTTQPPAHVCTLESTAVESPASCDFTRPAN